jgi:hypothetical protein
MRNITNLGLKTIPFLVPTRALWVLCAGKCGSRKNGSGTERNGTWETEVGGKATQMTPLHVR